MNSSCDTLLLCFKAEAAYLLACFCIDEQPCWQQTKKHGVFRSAACLCTVFCNKYILRLVCCVHRLVGTSTGSACAQAFCCTHSLFALSTAAAAGPATQWVSNSTPAMIPTVAQWAVMVHQWCRPSCCIEFAGCFVASFFYVHGTVLVMA